MHCEEKIVFKMKAKRGVKPVVVNMKLLIKFKDYLWMLICGENKFINNGNVCAWNVDWLHFSKWNSLKHLYKRGVIYRFLPVAFYRSKFWKSEKILCEYITHGNYVQTSELMF